MQRLDGADWFATVPTAALEALGSPRAADLRFEILAADAAPPASQRAILMRGSVLRVEGASVVVSCGGLLAGHTRQPRARQQTRRLSPDESVCVALTTATR